MCNLNGTMPKAYDTLLIELHRNVYGLHFSPTLLRKALEELEGEDGKKDPKWSLEESNKIIKNYDLKYKEYDFN